MERNLPIHCLGPPPNVHTLSLSIEFLSKRDIDIMFFNLIVLRNSSLLSPSVWSE